jgi:hypothetical protein
MSGLLPSDLDPHPRRGFKDALIKASALGREWNGAAVTIIAERLGWEEHLVKGLMSTGEVEATRLQNVAVEGNNEIHWDSVLALLTAMAHGTPDGCPLYGNDLRLRLIRLREARQTGGALLWRVEIKKEWRSLMLFEEEAKPADPPPEEPANKRKQEDDDDSGGKRARVEDGGGGGVAIAIGGVLIVLFVLMVR